MTLGPFPDPAPLLAIAFDLATGEHHYRDGGLRSYPEDPQKPHYVACNCWADFTGEDHGDALAQWKAHVWNEARLRLERQRLKEST